MVEDKIDDQAHYVIDSAVAIYQFPNSRDFNFFLHSKSRCYFALPNV